MLPVDSSYFLGQVQLGSRQAGIRPALVVSSDHRNEYSPVVWVVIITSQIKRLDLKSHVLLPKVKGLPKQSVVEAEQLFTVDKSYLGEYRGKLIGKKDSNICRMKSDKAELLKLGNKNDETEDRDGDDKDAGDLFKMQFLNIPTYSQDWREGLSIKLTAAEGEFLKTQIIHSFPDSMLAYILRNNMTEILGCKYFQDLASLIQSFPEDIQADYWLAADFSDFLYALRVLYNIIVSDGQNAEANAEWEVLKDSISELASVDLESIYKKLSIYRNPFLCKFLDRCKELMLAEDVEELKKEIRRRERELKQNRAKTMHPGEFDPNAWFSGKGLDYRFGDARTIIRDIWESEGLC